MTEEERASAMKRRAGIIAVLVAGLVVGGGVAVFLAAIHLPSDFILPLAAIAGTLVMIIGLAPLYLWMRR